MNDAVKALYDILPPDQEFTFQGPHQWISVDMVRLRSIVNIGLWVCFPVTIYTHNIILWAILYSLQDAICALLHNIVKLPQKSKVTIYRNGDSVFCLSGQQKLSYKVSSIEDLPISLDTLLDKISEFRDKQDATIRKIETVKFLSMDNKSIIHELTK